jgi:hypothetical protein
MRHHKCTGAPHLYCGRTAPLAPGSSGGGGGGGGGDGGDGESFSEDRMNLGPAS